MALPPAIYTGTYLTKTPGVGSLYVQANTGAGGTVLDTLVTPPTTAASALTAVNNRNKAKGTSAMTSPVKGWSTYTPQNLADQVKRNYDFIMLRYLEASIARSGGVPIF